jgi:phenylpyruvate tautomerase PptA (4-oxalocrotonate tautomerase family)
MPLVTIEAILPKDEKRIPLTLSEVQKVGAKALNCAESNIWVVFKPLIPEFYSHAVNSQQTEPPVIVTVKAQAGRALEAKCEFVENIAAAISRGLSVSPSSVWIHYQEMDPSDIWFEQRWARRRFDSAATYTT